MNNELSTSMLSLLKSALKSIGVKVAHMNQKNPGSRERLQVWLPIGKALHIFVDNNKLLIGHNAYIRSAKYSLDFVDPAKDPAIIVEMFKTMCEAQIAFMNKCEKL